MKSLKNLIFLFLVCGTQASCGQTTKKEEKTSETVQKEEAVAAKKPVDEEKSTPQTIEFVDQSTYKYSVSLPSTWKVETLYEESLDYCNYEASLPDGTKVLELNAMLNTRFDSDNIQDLYTEALEGTALKITYKLQKDNWFVISGIDEATKNIVYVKRVLGEQYVSDLRFTYTKSEESRVAPYIGRIAASFESQ